METKPTGIVVLMPAGRLDHPTGAIWQALEILVESRPTDGTNKFTLLDDAVQGFRGTAGGGWAGEAGRQLVGLRHPGGVRRHLFGVGEGPAETVAEAKQESTGVMRRQFVKKFVREQWILSCKSLERPLVYPL